MVSVLAATGPAPDGAGPVGVGRILERLYFQAWRPAPPPLDVGLDEVATVLEPLATMGGAGLVWPRIQGRRDEFGAVALALQFAWESQRTQNASYPASAARAVHLLREHGIDPILVKGWTVSRLYAPPAVRLAGDIDLIVPPAEFDRARAAIAADQRTNGALAIDLHHDEMWVDRPRPSFRNETVTMEIGGAKVRVLDPVDQLYVLCHHFIRHSAIRPLWLCDIGAALEGRPEDFDWDRFLGSNRRERNWVLTSLALAHVLVGARIDDLPIRDQIPDLPGWLVPAVYRRWELAQKPPPAVFDVVGQKGVRELFRQRWPEPIGATIYCRVPFNRFPRLPIQAAAYANRIAWYGLTRLPRQGREYLARGRR